MVIYSSDLSVINPGNSVAKYTDTYIIIPSANVGSRMEELANVEAWSQVNNLTLNCSKSLEIIFTDKKWKQSFQQSQLIPNMSRIEAINILSVNINIISSCSQCLCPAYTQDHKTYPLTPDLHRHKYLKLCNLYQLLDSCNLYK